MEPEERNYFLGNKNFLVYPPSTPPFAIKYIAKMSPMTLEILVVEIREETVLDIDCSVLHINI
jgi:hypothetical protein